MCSVTLNVINHLPANPMPPFFSCMNTKWIPCQSDHRAFTFWLFTGSNDPVVATLFQLCEYKVDSLPI